MGDPGNLGDLRDLGDLWDLGDLGYLGYLGGRYCITTCISFITDLAAADVRIKVASKTMNLNFQKLTLRV